MERPLKKIKDSFTLKALPLISKKQQNQHHHLQQQHHHRQQSDNF